MSGQGEKITPEPLHRAHLNKNKTTTLPMGRDENLNGLTGKEGRLVMPQNISQVGLF